MESLFANTLTAMSGSDVQCESPASSRHVKFSPPFDTPSTLDFGSSAISVDCSTDSVSQPDLVENIGANENPYQSYFDEPSSINASRDCTVPASQWGDLSDAATSLLDPNVLRMFVDSLTRSITGQEAAPTILPPTTPMSSGEYTPPYPSMRRSGTNVSMVSNQSAMDRSGDSTTVMLRNVPYDARQQGVLSLLIEEEFGFDFFYAPLDFKSRNNLGYAFINLIDPDTARRFFDHFDGKRVTSRVGWEKPLRVCWARVQGLDANIDHYRNSPVNEMPTEFKPMLFAQDGSPMVFPAPDGPLNESTESRFSSMVPVRPRERRLQTQNSRGFLTPMARSGSSLGSNSLLTPQPGSSCKIFVGGLSPETSSEALEEYMSRFGRVSDCHVLIDTQTGRSRCYGFCSFVFSDCAETALNHSKAHIIDGRGVVVRPYTSSRET